MLQENFQRKNCLFLPLRLKEQQILINLNLAEGSTGQSNKEFIKFLRYSLRSNIEVVSCIFIAREREIISEENFNKIYEMGEEILAMIIALIKKLNNEQQ